MVAFSKRVCKAARATVSLDDARENGSRWGKCAPCVSRERGALLLPCRLRLRVVFLPELSGGLRWPGRIVMTEESPASRNEEVGGDSLQPGSLAQRGWILQIFRDNDVFQGGVAHAASTTGAGLRTQRGRRDGLDLLGPDTDHTPSSGQIPQLSWFLRQAFNSRNLRLVRVSH